MSASVPARAASIDWSICSASGERVWVFTARADMDACGLTLVGGYLPECHPRYTIDRIAGPRAGAATARSSRRGSARRVRSPSRQIPAGRGRGCAPCSGPRPIQRAPSTRSMCPWENTARRAAVLAQLGDHTVRARAHLRVRSRRRGSRRATDSSRARARDLCARQALILAVVPLEQVRALEGVRAVPAQLAGFPGAARRADEHEVKAPRAEPGGQCGGGLAAAGGERDVGAARVPAGKAPLRLGVAHEHDLAAPCAHARPPGMASSSAITISRPRLSRLAGTCSVGSASIPAIASALLAPVARSMHAARRAQHRQAQREALAGAAWASRSRRCTSAGSPARTRWSGEQRGDVPVGADPEHDQVEHRRPGRGPRAGRRTSRAHSRSRPRPGRARPCIRWTCPAGTRRGRSSVSAASR